MKIAILMSTYNGEKFLDKQLESIAMQTVAQDITLYIRDDGSTDRTFDIIENWKNKIHIVLYKGKNAGPAMSFWKLLMNQEIQADYYAFCDQDDIWDNNKVEESIKALAEGYCLTICNSRLIDQNDSIIAPKYIGNTPTFSYQSLFISGIAQGCAMTFTNEFRKYICKKKISCIPMHDIIINLYALSFGRIKWIETPLFGYRVHSNNVVAKGNKGLFKGIKTTIWNWKNSSKYSMGDVAKELLNNSTDLNDVDERFLINASVYRKRLSAKINLLRNKATKDTNMRIKRSYYLRIALNLY